MPTVFVSYAQADAAFVETTLNPALSLIGFDQWLSSGELPSLESSLRDAIQKCDAIVVVVSKAAARSSSVMEEVQTGLACRQPLVPIRIDATRPSDLTLDLEALPAAEPPGTKDEPAPWKESELFQLLAGLLPPIGIHAHGADVPGAESLPWHESFFSARLKEALERQDHSGAATLVAVLVARIDRMERAYPARHANADLAVLRKKRQFSLMCRYGEALLRSGTDHLEVQRQYAQALIEGGRFDEALALLRENVKRAGKGTVEMYEARGLIGRTLKQQYVDAPHRRGARELLCDAIDAYESVYEEDAKNLWHGVNAASLIRRAWRDGITDFRPQSRAKDIAREILRATDKPGPAHLDVWSCATRVEAWLALDEKPSDVAGAAALHECERHYLPHPEGDAFEFTSTHRQFEQVLQLGEGTYGDDGRTILDHLWEVVERLRGASHYARPSLASDALKPILIRVSDPNWTPKMDPQHLVVHGRLGTIVAADSSRAGVKSLLQDRAVVSIEESRPAGVKECARSLPFVKVAGSYPGTGPVPFSESGDRALVAIIDDGLDVLHEAFLDDKGRSRVVGIWDQRDNTGMPPPSFSFGTHHDRAQIQAYVADKTVPSPLGRNSTGHGTHVASIAAGRKAGSFAGGVAPNASILVVITKEGDPIGYSNAHVLALRYIDQMAQQLDLPVVVNVSQGMNAGAHDGTSLLEGAFENFLNYGRKPGRIVVKSAGNERDKNAHATLALPDGAADDIRWERDADAELPREDIEVWWSSGNDFRFRLIAPFGQTTDWVSESQPSVVTALADGTKCQLSFTKLHVDNGDDLLKIGMEGRPIAPGTWKLEIESQSTVGDGRIHAWIERAGAKPSVFVNHVSEEMTLSIPGTAENVITVGAVNAAVPITTGTFSSYGPTRRLRNKPDLCAPGIGIEAARAGTSDGIVASDGTSMAAPHVAGAIALALSRRAKSGRDIPTATQIASVLRHKTRQGKGVWNAGQGYGVLDVAALLAAFPS